MRALLSLMLGGVLTLTGCATIPLAPSVAVMPAPGKPFDLFVGEENLCRQYAAQQVGQTPAETMGGSAVTGAAAGTVLGAAAGAALGALSGRPGLGAAAGAGSGLLLGTVVGGGTGHDASAVLQSRYDIAYTQCMYAKGNQVPGVAWSPPTPPPPPTGFPPR